MLPVQATALRGAAEERLQIRLTQIAIHRCGTNSDARVTLSEIPLHAPDEIIRARLDDLFPICNPITTNYLSKAGFLFHGQRVENSD